MCDDAEEALEARKITSPLTSRLPFAASVYKLSAWRQATSADVAGFQPVAQQKLRRWLRRKPT